MLFVAKILELLRRMEIHHGDRIRPSLFGTFTWNISQMVQSTVDQFRVQILNLNF